MVLELLRPQIPAILLLPPILRILLLPPPLPCSWRYSN